MIVATSSIRLVEARNPASSEFDTRPNLTSVPLSVVNGRKNIKLFLEVSTGLLAEVSRKGVQPLGRSGQPCRLNRTASVRALSITSIDRSTSFSVVDQLDRNAQQTFASRWRGADPGRPSLLYLVGHHGPHGSATSARSTMFSQWARPISRCSRATRWRYPSEGPVWVDRRRRRLESRRPIPPSPDLRRGHLASHRLPSPKPHRS